MTISSNQIHNVLRTYGKQLRRGLRLNRIKASETDQTSDQVRISPEAKRLRVIDRVSAEILYRLTDPTHQLSETEQQVIDTLNEEHGSPLQISYDEAAGRFNFEELDADKGDKGKTLDETQIEKLNVRLVEITKQVVDRSMI